MLNWLKLQAAATDRFKATPDKSAESSEKKGRADKRATRSAPSAANKIEKPSTEQDRLYLTDVKRYLNFGSTDGLELAICTPAPRKYNYLRPSMEKALKLFERSADQTQENWDKFATESNTLLKNIDKELEKL